LCSCSLLLCLCAPATMRKRRPECSGSRLATAAIHFRLLKGSAIVAKPFAQSQVERLGLDFAHHQYPRWTYLLAFFEMGVKDWPSLTSAPTQLRWQQGFPPGGPPEYSNFWVPSWKHPSCAAPMTFFVGYSLTSHCTTQRSEQA
jgi:hypothetical protein